MNPLSERKGLLSPNALWYKDIVSLDRCWGFLVVEVINGFVLII